MREIIIRIPGQKKDLILGELEDDLTIDALKEIIHQKHEDQPDPAQQRLIHSGKMLENGQRLDELNLNSDNQGSAVIHLVVSKVGFLLFYIESYCDYFLKHKKQFF